MAKKESTTEESTSSLDQASLEKKIEELEAKVRAGEEAALSRVCKALKVSEDEVLEKEADEQAKEAKRKNETKIRCHVPFPVRVNARTYEGFVEVPESVFDVIQQAVGDKRMRLLREKIGQDHIIEMVAGVGYVPRVVGQVNEYGEKIA